MANFHQQLIGARRALLILGWALVIAKVAFALEARLNAPVTLADRSRLLEDGAIISAGNSSSYAAGQLIIRFRDNVSAARCEEVLRTQGAKSPRLLDPLRNLYLVELPAPQRVLPALDRFAVLAEVDYAVPNALTYAK